MPSNLSKYVARSPRYILHAEDNTLIRLAGPNQVPWEEGTEISNMSASGIAFTAPADLCPIVGEIVKVQFDVPGASGMAAFALVIRVEPQASKPSDRNNELGTVPDSLTSGASRMLVATQFVQMDTPQKLHLAHGLGKKIKNAFSDQNQIDIGYPKKKKTFLYFGLGLVLLLLWCGLFFLWYPGT